MSEAEREENRQWLIARGHLIHLKTRGGGTKLVDDGQVSECNEVYCCTTERSDEVTCPECIDILAGEVARQLGGWL